MNIPSVGETLQHFFTNVQVNISPAAANVEDCKFISESTICGDRDVLTSDTAQTFQSALGQFAYPHIDKQDAGAALTAMVSLPNIPDDYDPGIFAYHDLKMFIKPSGCWIAYFTGLHRHGGTAPSPPSGKPANPWAYRLAIICYPNGPTMGGESRNALVPFRGFDIVLKKETKNNRKDVLKMPPEVRKRERYLFLQLYWLRSYLSISIGLTATGQTLHAMGQPSKVHKHSSPP